MKTPLTLPEQAVLLMNQLDLLANRLMHEGRAAQEDGVALTRHEFRVIEALGRQGCCTMKQVGQSLCLALSTLTTVVDRLVARHLATRERSDEDRRVVRVRLAPAGQRLFQRCRQGRLRMAHAMLAALDEEERRSFLALFRKIGQTRTSTQRRASPAGGPGPRSRRTRR
jgi:DNA-binding MarR family transcriptional regulator